MPYCHACHLLQPARAQITSSLLVRKRYYEDGREDLENWWHVEWHDAAYVHSNHVGSSYSSMCAISGGEGDLHRVSRLLQVPPSEERRVLPVLTPFASATRRPSSLRTRRRRRSTLDRRSDSPLACVAGLRPTDGARGAPRGGAASFLSTPRASVLFGIPLDASAARRRSAAPPRSCRAPSPVATSTPRRAARRGGYLGQRRLYAQGTARACPEDAQ